jgi:hemoglobin-like flavoprotein
MCLQVKPLSIRHIKYGVKAEYVKCFGAVVTNVLKKALGDKCTPEVAAAWAYAWGGVSRCITECLNIGSSLVTVALVNTPLQIRKSFDPHDGL